MDLNLGIDLSEIINEILSDENLNINDFQNDNNNQSNDLTNDNIENYNIDVNVDSELLEISYPENTWDQVLQATNAVN
jgi:hypothetical protein